MLSTHIVLYSAYKYTLLTKYKDHMGVACIASVSVWVRLFCILAKFIALASMFNLYVSKCENICCAGFTGRISTPGLDSVDYV